MGEICGRVGSSCCRWSTAVHPTQCNLTMLRWVQVVRADTGCEPLHFSFVQHSVPIRMLLRQYSSLILSTKSSVVSSVPVTDFLNCYMGAIPSYYTCVGPC